MSKKLSPLEASRWLAERQFIIHYVEVAKLMRIGEIECADERGPLFTTVAALERYIARDGNKVDEAPKRKPPKYECETRLQRRERYYERSMAEKAEPVVEEDPPAPMRPPLNEKHNWRFITVAAAHNLLVAAGIEAGQETIRRAIRAGDLAAVKIGRKLYIQEASLETFLTPPEKPRPAEIAKEREVEQRSKPVSAVKTDLIRNGRKPLMKPGAYERMQARILERNRE